MLHGTEPFSDSKVCCENVVANYRNCFFRGRQTIALSTARYDNVFGGGDYTSGKLLPDCINALKQSKMVEYQHNITISPFLHVLDLVNGLILLAKRQNEEKHLEGAYYFGSEYDECAMTSNLVMMICKLWGGEASCRWAPPMQTIVEPLKIHLDISKSQNNLQWQPRLNTENAVKKLVEWEKTVIRGIGANEITDNQIDIF